MKKTNYDRGEEDKQSEKVLRAPLKSFVWWVCWCLSHCLPLRPHLSSSRSLSYFQSCACRASNSVPFPPPGMPSAIVRGTIVGLALSLCVPLPPLAHALHCSKCFYSLYVEIKCTTAQDVQLACLHSIFVADGRPASSFAMTVYFLRMPMK